MLNRFHFFCCLATSFVLAFNVVAGEPTRFGRDVLPILSDKCFNCHGPDAENREADLRLDTHEGALAVLDIDEPAESELLRRIQADDPDERMPPPGSNLKPLSNEEIAKLERWVRIGAKWGKHWSFETPVRPSVPRLDGTEQLSAIDAFVRQRLKEVGLAPAPAASKRTLIRRVTLDLIGLPPTPDEVDDFVRDGSPDAYEKVVDRLLQSHHYGERMAWPWLDAARYADTGGYQGDPERTMWPWRDWLVDALNSNMPFDQFTIECLAGDLLPNSTDDQKLASGFNRNHMHNSEGGRIAEETRVENVFDRTETTGTVWLGLTLQCARCHDHKFDPTSNADYFSFFDFFNQSSENGKTDRSAAVPPNIEYETKRSGKIKVMVMDTADKRRETFVLVKGIYNNVTDQKVTANVPSMLPGLPKRSDDSRCNRLDLAKWIVDSGNPLTARVTVNRYWQLFFGRGIVATPDDFGLQGSQPTHPELLDWLAIEFMESGWEVKRMHKLIVMSKTYQQSARVSKEVLEIDPNNKFLARSPRYRMPSWMLRDQALAISGLLSPTLGGPPVRPYQPKGIWAEATFGKKKYELDVGDNLYRRSMYTFWRRIVGPTIFFDAAKRQTCEVKPSRTNTPLHALATLNDVTYVEAARVLAERLLKAHDSEAERLRRVFFTLTAREPTAVELKLLMARLKKSRAEFIENGSAAIELLSVGNAERDNTLDAAEHAAYTAIINVLMNLDEVLCVP